ncbi:alpha-glucan family phosphorylase [Actinopolymorpha cephalotaxi]|uniref:glycogen phosphorylase n=2 Tax=Actinopolymorpha cephalotaxi TaxID=504797 RepID=A0ABX2RXA6_9ACTN|nr:alpha-glucan family phosphorylase [Actinopolymorpha cephalotaxi]NYH81995.1 starch phosphorylase [Actinopolymorpha cephalotaxi]
MRAIRRFTVRPVLPEPLAPLGDLAMNLRWSWHPPTQDLFAAVDPRLWASTGHDPMRLLSEVATDRLTELGSDETFLSDLRSVAADLDAYVHQDRWYQTLGSDVPRQIAYFSPEFGLTAVLPQYSGGLGILAGDHLKAASDLGAPLIGVGLLYRHGYFKQSLSGDGWQQERYPIVDPQAMPLSLLREADGTAARVSVGLPGDRRLVAQVWVAHVGRVPLLLLDSGIEDNEPAERDTTDRLYGGGTEHRLLQEMLLGVGGVRALRAYCRITGAPAPEVFHTNEGHAGFLGLERIREYVEDRGLDFDAAVEVTRAGTVFTTHTPVPAGIDRFARDLVQQHFGGDNEADGVPVDRILALGAEDYEGGDPGLFNMAVMGFRLGQRANGVSALHGVVSRGMFAGLWPGFDETEVPIASITNGVHAGTWVAREMTELVSRPEVDPTDRDGAEDWAGVDQVPESAIWKTKAAMRARLVDYARDRLRESWLARGASEAELGWVADALDPDVLTIGFARRVPSYKRLTLMLSDRDRLKRMLLDPERPIQLVIAGKSHPADDGGKRLIQEIVWFADDPEVRHRIVFLPDYDMGLAHPLVTGCDVWLNNPLRPYEACGTSGMKAALNGGLNVSIRDGWWDEWYDGQNGWAIPSADGVNDPDRRDDLEAHALYDLLEHQVAARFYDRDEHGLPRRWLEMVRHTLKSLGPKVLATRMFDDYVTKLYAPAALSSRAMNSSFDGARQLAAWKRRVREGWGGVHVDHVESVGTGEGAELGGAARLRVFVSLGGLSPDDVDIQVLHGRVDEADRLQTPSMVSLERAEDYEAGRYRYEGQVRFDRTGPVGYTVRILPKNADLSSPAELGLVAWPPAASPMVNGDLR